MGLGKQILTYQIFNSKVRVNLLGLKNLSKNFYLN